MQFKCKWVVAGAVGLMHTIQLFKIRKNKEMQNQEKLNQKKCPMNYINSMEQPFPRRFAASFSNCAIDAIKSRLLYNCRKWNENDSA